MAKTAKDYIDEAMPASLEPVENKGRIFPIVPVKVDDEDRYPDLKEDLIALALVRMKELYPTRDVQPDKHMMNHDGWGLVFRVDREK